MAQVPQALEPGDAFDPSTLSVVPQRIINIGRRRCVAAHLANSTKVIGICLLRRVVRKSHSSGDDRLAG